MTIEKRKLLAIGKSSAHNDDKWLIGQIVKVNTDSVRSSTQKGGFVGAEITAITPWDNKPTLIYSCAVKLSKKRY